MNNLQKELAKVAGDMTASKERVKARVLQHQTKRRQKPLRFAILTTIVTLCIAGFILVQFAAKETEQGALLLNEAQFGHFKQLSRIWGFSQEEGFSKEDIYRSYEQLVASYYFGESLGLTYTKTELEVERQKQIDELTSFQQSPNHAKLFRGLAPAEYVEAYAESLLPMYTMRTKLYEMYRGKYPEFSTFYEVADLDAKRYFQAHFAEQLSAFQQAHHMKQADYAQGSNKVGTVAHIEENMFLFVEGVIPADIEQLSKEEVFQQYKGARWYPLLADFSIAQGDYLTLRSLQEMVSERNGAIYQYGLADSVKVFQPDVTKRLEVHNEQEVAQILQGLSWQPKAYLGRPPAYSFLLEGVRIEIWKGYDGALHLYKIGSGELQLKGEQAQQLKALLGIAAS